MASFEIEYQTCNFTDENPEVREMVMAHVSGTSRARTKPRPPQPPVPALPSTSGFLARAAKSSFGILLPSVSYSQSQPRLLPLWPGAAPEGSSAGLALTQRVLAVLSTRTRLLYKESRNRPDYTRT